jgi:hypothetical protein
MTTRTMSSRYLSDNSLSKVMRVLSFLVEQKCQRDRRIVHVRLKCFRLFGNFPWNIRTSAPRLFDLSAEDIIKTWDDLYNAA